MYLLDTNVVSELRKVKSRRAHSKVVAWNDSVAPAETFISAITVMELELGVLRIERRDPGQGSIMRGWMDERVLPAFGGRVLPIDSVVAQRCAALHVPDPRPERDAYIAATALTHGMTVVTRNVQDFELIGVATLNPWEWSPV
jgi:hypothetical protein